MKKGDFVKVCVEIMGLKSCEKQKVVKITKRGIFLEHSDHPFNVVTGNLDYMDGVGLGRQYIVGFKKYVSKGP